MVILESDVCACLQTADENKCGSKKSKRSEVLTDEAIDSITNMVRLGPANVCI